MTSKYLSAFGILILLTFTALNLNSLLSNQFKWYFSSFSCRTTNDCDCSNFTGPYIAPGPSEVNKIIPMEELKETLRKHSSIHGLKMLDQLSLSRYSQCKPKRNLKNTMPKEITWCHQRSFIMGSRPLVALASFHGSGNTWLRYLLEQATGIFTGSIYCDELLKITFPGEFIVSGSVVAVKTHHADSPELPKDVQLFLKKKVYDKAIVLVRNPFDALLSEANRRWNSKKHINDHIGLADERKFIGNANWDWYVEYKGASWAYFIHTWLSQNNTEILIVQYEKLVSNLEDELVRIMNFLNLIPQESYLECALREREGIYKRSTHLNFDPYSRENLDNINRYIEPALKLLLNYNISYSLR